MDRTEQAVCLFQKGYNCAQAILAVWCERFGLPQETAVKLAGGLGGGIGRNGETCGALTGAVLVLGLRYGTADPLDKNTKYDLYRRTRELMHRFKDHAGSLYCRQLLGFDMATPEGLAASQKPGAFDECPQFVRIAAELLDKMLE
ncbi:MAG TPA: C-GCAxxG-C-C family protein [Anaerohalosphaeraceae bacterium]|nr:C-GCAxxG-C-C family protein [Anaerohalosphaeraceae bacterium]